MKRSLLLALVPALCFACKKKAPEPIPQPKAEPVKQAAAVSTAPVSSNLLEAPGNYLKTTVGHINEAKAARALYEKTARQEAASLDLNNTGGN